MDLPRESYEQVQRALDRLLVQAAIGCDPAKGKHLRRKVTELKSEPTKPVKLGAPPRKVVWWPSSCRGIVGLFRDFRLRFHRLPVPVVSSLRAAFRGSG